jgi:hypothetical protein
MPGNECKTRNYVSRRNFDFVNCHRMKRKHCHKSGVALSLGLKENVQWLSHSGYQNIFTSKWRKLGQSLGKMRRILFELKSELAC